MLICFYKFEVANEYVIQLITGGHYNMVSVNQRNLKQRFFLKPIIDALPLRIYMVYKSVGNEIK